jgi:hypothetical protein
MSIRPLRGALALALFIATAAPLAGQAPAVGPAAPAEADDTALLWPAERAYRSKRPIDAVRDSASGEVTTSLVVEQGKYLLWMQRPRVTVASVRPADLPAGDWPAAVYLEFRTQSPQYTATNRLTLTADDSLRFEAPATASRVRHRTFVNEHTLTFVLPLDDFLRFAHGTRGQLEVGGVIVRLKPEQLQALRALAQQIHTAGVASGGA